MPGYVLEALTSFQHINPHDPNTHHTHGLYQHLDSRTDKEDTSKLLDTGVNLIQRIIGKAVDHTMLVALGELATK